MTTDTEPDTPISPLLAAILTKNATDTANVTNAVIDGLTARAEKAEETLAAVRRGVEALLRKPWMPTPDAIRTALYPLMDGED